MSELENIEAMLAPLSLGVMHKSGQRVYDNIPLYEAIQAYADRVAKEAVIKELGNLKENDCGVTYLHDKGFGRAVPMSVVLHRIQALTEEAKE